MQVIPATDAHLSENSTPNLPFPLLTDIDTNSHLPSLRPLLFTNNTLPLSSSQADVVCALLRGTSVIYHQPNVEDRYLVFVDMVLRNRLWKHRIVYCASSKRAAQAAYAVLCSQLGLDRAQEVCLDLGYQSSHLPAPSGSQRVLITIPHVLRIRLLNPPEKEWLFDAKILFIDHLTSKNILEWEELLLAIPSNFLVCLFARYLPTMHRQLLPLWVETIQNPLVSVTSPAGATLLDRIERPHDSPLLRTFAYNAATHQCPVQISLSLLKDMLLEEISQSSAKFIPNYTECFLHGITIIPSHPPGNLLFNNVQQAEYADLCAVLVADAQRLSEKLAKRRRPKTQRKKERTPSSRAAARRRRETAVSESLVLPAIALVKGKMETIDAADAVISALGDDLKLLWDDDSLYHLQEIVNWYKGTREEHVTETDTQILNALLLGVGVVNHGSTPDLRQLIEELFRSGLVPLLIADTCIGSEELSALPCAKSVFMESGAMAACDDRSKGLLMTQTAAALAGRAGKDDVGNLIVLWYDESVDDETAGYEIASTMLQPLFEEEELAVALRVQRKSHAKPARMPKGILEADNILAYLHKNVHSPLSSSYDGVLRAVRRFGLDGYQTIFEHSLSAYRGWLERAALRATLEKVHVEKEAVMERLKDVDWSAIAEHERREAKMDEAARVFKAMNDRYDSVRSSRIVSQLKASSAGRIVGVACSKESASALPWAQRIIEAEETIYSSSPSGAEMAREDDKLSTTATATGPSSGSRNGEHEELVVQGAKTGKKEILSAVVFVAVMDQNEEGHLFTGLSSRYAIVCILPDGMWTALPLGDVVALADEEEDVISNVDLLLVPHPATYDMDPVSQWAKCRPIDESEKAAVHRVSDELIARVASEERPELVPLMISEFEVQKGQVEQAQNFHRQSPWYGRDEEILELRILRRKEAEMKDEIKWLRKTESQLEEELFGKHNTQRSIQSSLMAVLEDCHGVSVIGDHAMEMTPIGALASILPGEHPLFAAACLSLIDEVENLSPMHLACFVAQVTCTGQKWQGLDIMDRSGNGRGSEEDDDDDDGVMDLSLIQKSSDGDEENEVVLSQGSRMGKGRYGYEEEIIPAAVQNTIDEIQQALLQLHRRHLEENHGSEMGSISDIVPIAMNKRLARVVGMFVQGDGWNKMMQEIGGEGSGVVSELQRVRTVLDVMCAEEGVGEFSEKARKLARMTYDSMERWPVKEENIVGHLMESGVLEKQWSGTTYDKWWRSVRGDLTNMKGRKGSGEGRETSERIESVEAEIAEG